MLLQLKQEKWSAAPFHWQATRKHSTEEASTHILILADWQATNNKSLEPLPHIHRLADKHPIRKTFLSFSPTQVRKRAAPLGGRVLRLLWCHSLPKWIPKSWNQEKPKQNVNNLKSFKNDNLKNTKTLILQMSGVWVWGGTNVLSWTPVWALGHLGGGMLRLLWEHSLRIPYHNGFRSCEVRKT